MKKGPEPKTTVFAQFRALVGLGLFSFTICVAAEPAADVAGETVQEVDALERLWSFAELHHDDENPVFQELAIIGRYHGQYWSVNADEGDANDWENRRIYFGAEARMFHEWKLHTQIKVAEDFSPFYDGIYQAYVEWNPNESFSARVGRVDFLYAGLERTVSSTRIRVFERGLLVNQVMPAEVVGVLVTGEANTVSYHAGIFSGSIEDEFTDFSGGVGAVVGIGWNLPLFYDEGGIHLDYLFNDGDSGNNALEPYDHIVSLWHRGSVGAFDVGVDFTWANGLESLPAAWSLTVLPTWVFAENLLRDGDALQAVFRYQLAGSDGDNGLQLQRRYEQEVASGVFGDRYQAWYAGLDYLVMGDRLKFMVGVECAEMDDRADEGGDFKGATWMAGVRMYL